MMNQKLKSCWLGYNLASIDINVLRESNILTDQNILDPMFLIALEFSTKFGALDTNISKSKPKFKEILSLGISLLLEKLDFTTEENHGDYISAILALIERQSTTDSMNKNFTSENDFSFYG
mgnify:CR=1 FL=1